MILSHLQIKDTEKEKDINELISFNKKGYQRISGYQLISLGNELTLLFFNDKGLLKEEKNSGLTLFG